MEFKDLIAARRSVRSYQSGVTRKDLEAICRAAQQAPSWMNRQTARCYVLETPEVLESLRDAALPSFNRNSSANAALIVTTFVKGIVGFGSDGQPVDDIGNGWGIYDLGLHDAYLILAAKDLGYDTLIMGLRDVDLLREKLGIPDNEELISVIAVGRSDATPAAPPRKPLEETVKFF